ncbi:MAG: phosphate acyltransferase PlsX [Oscillospiraceae bacterium]|nr:phosphate acyltransferase PlsX [Oscillospiraceae bacterium]MCC8156836.1 phosphate acyltransferase PlsX [Oscillospiraceae bacterium]MCD8128927.1 phosphate acyltransferase PlsX [Oscillospiraceae bacterium]
MSNAKLKIIVDAMSGDNAPGEIVKGALSAAQEFGVDIVLVGQEDALQSCLRENGAVNAPYVSIQNATEIIDMHDDPSTATRRKGDSSMSVALRMLRDGEGDAAVSAGNTGALLTGATLIVKRIRGIRRAAFAPVLPNGGAGTLLIDGGASVECTPEYLLQFAFMGSFYAKQVMGCPQPRVGLLNNGSEESKGTELCRTSYALLRQAGDAGRINFIGNVEGNDVFSGAVDVVVTDGFTGNILLKTAEGMGAFFLQQIRRLLASQSTGASESGAALKQQLSGLRRAVDANEVGGTAFLGIRRPVIKAHGGADARAFRSSVKQAITFVNADVIQEIEENISYMRLHDPAADQTGE